MIRLILFFYLVNITFAIYTILYKRKYFIFSFFMLISFSPFMQYIVYPEFTIPGQYYDLNYKRLSVELINTIILFFFAATNVFTKVNRKVRLNNHLTIFIFFVIFLWIVFNTVSLINAIDLERSIPSYIISVIQPFLLLFVFNNWALYANLTSEKLILAISAYISINILITLIGLIFNFNRLDENGVSLSFFQQQIGVFRGNAGINMLAFFVPFIFNFELKYSKSTNLLFNISRLLLLILILMTASRTGFFIFLIALIVRMFTFLRRKPSLIVRIMSFGALFITIILLIFPDWGDFLLNRTLYKLGNTIDSSLERDMRLVLWSFAMDLVPHNPLWGIGLSNFQTIAPYGLSNAHNLYLNILTERGILALTSFLLMIFIFFRINLKIQKFVVDLKMRLIIKDLSLGFLLYLVMSFTMEDLIVVGGLIHAIIGNTLFAIVFFHTYYYNYLLNNSNAIKNIRKHI